MATRAQIDLSPNPKVKTYTAATGETITEGRAVKLASADEEIAACAAGNAALGIALDSCAAGERAEVLISPDAICKVKVGTGGATRGLWAVVVSDGLTDSGTLGGGTTLVNVIGRFLQTGVVGDTVAFQFHPFAAVKA
jgi:hypothetical protein